MTAQTTIEIGVSKETKEKVKRPSMYVVIVHNDPITPRAFVVHVLKKHFNKNEEEATRIMLLAHNYGIGAISTYTFEIAESKAEAANTLARLEGYPLTFSVQEA